ncbi:U11/U12 small nuclear ribonucleoprotein 48 kDa protein [Hyperolius riggenbachi]|uniref:U11/U12 small nuclear ribonucleoprotein 48 kDa protein n=1 Tax=Hyperolius riggenbachi TaxID=752182 RepID=UPI0035A2A456
MQKKPTANPTWPGHLHQRRRAGATVAATEFCDPLIFYEKANEPRVVLDKAKQFQIIKDAKDRAPNTSENGSWEKSVYSSSPVEVPLNHKRAVCDLTPADRLAIYDYVTQQTKESKPAPENSESDLFEDLTAKIKRDDDLNCPKSHLEIMAEMRDYKRRRQSYRAKNVHITKKSYTEIIRDVINVHMKELNNTCDEELQDDSSSTVSSSSVRRREHNRSPSVESRQSGGSRRNRGHSGRRRELSRSPRRHRSQDRDRESRRKRDRDEDRPHGHKR